MVHIDRRTVVLNQTKPPRIACRLAFRSACALQTFLVDSRAIPANDGANKCARVVAKAYGKLVYSVYKCHYALGAATFGGKLYDEEACEETAPKGALSRYNAYVQKAIDAGICPPCLAGNAATLGANAVAALDAQNVEIFPCP